MIDVTAKLLNGSVYLAGQTIEILISFTNPTHNLQAADDVETLAWSSAQIHCNCSVNDDKVEFPIHEATTPEDKAKVTTDTSFVVNRGERGHVVLATKPKILFCDLKLAPGETRSFMYQETVPYESPPSYRGHCVKYTYKITIGTQRVNSPIKLLRVPVRILVLYGLVEKTAWSSELEDVTPSNPFLVSTQKETPLDVALHLLQCVTARRSPSFYNATNHRGRVVRFGLFKLAYRQGEDIVGIFDFSNANVPCVQFLVTLQSEETLSETCKKREGQATHTISYSKYHETCLNMEHTRMILPIPLHITPSFQTDIISLHWKLHFEFVTTTSDFNRTELDVENKETGESYWYAPSVLNIETMVWDLPIKIYPTAPINVSQGMHLETKHQATL